MQGVAGPQGEGVGRLQGAELAGSTPGRGGGMQGAGSSS